MVKRGMFTGLGVGLGLMYFFDPDLGKRRRKVARDQILSTANDLSQAIEIMFRDASNRAQGWIADASSLVLHDEVSEQRLAERVRAVLGHHVSHPGSIEVSVEDDRVILSGPVLAYEVDRLLSAVASVRGVREVENRLESHEETGSIPGLQGGAERSRDPASWVPATRLVASLIGGGLVLRALRRPNLVTIPLAAVGFKLLSGALEGFLSVTRTSVGRRGIEFRKTIHIKARREQIYDLLANPENFPRVMTNVRDVQRLGEGRWRWTVAGPMGVPVHFTAFVTQSVPNEVLMWQSESNSPVEHSGRIRLQDNPDGSVRVDLQMSYRPPAGTAGHVVASLFRSDPKSQLDQDLLRMKTFLETGKQSHDATATGQQP